MISARPKSSMLGRVFHPNPLSASHPLNQGRTFWWLSLEALDGGPKLYDLMGRCHGTLTNYSTNQGWFSSLPRPGALGRNIKTDGTGNKAIIGTGFTALGDPSSVAWSMAAWVRLDSTSTQPVNFFTIANFGSGSTLDFTYNSNAFQLTNGGGSSRVNSGVAATVGQWYRVLVTSDGTTRRMYVNDVFAASSATGLSSFTPDTATGLIWDTAFGFFQNITGAVDDLTIWSRKLSDADVIADYALSSTGYPGVLNRLSRRLVGAAPAIGAALLLRRRRLRAAA